MRWGVHSLRLGLLGMRLSLHNVLGLWKLLGWNRVRGRWHCILLLLLLQLGWLDLMGLCDLLAFRSLSDRSL